METNFTLIDRFQSIDAPQQCRLSAPRRTNQANDLMFLNVERNTGKHFQCAITFIGLIDFNQCHVFGPSSQARACFSAIAFDQTIYETRLRDGDQDEKNGHRGDS